MTPEEAFSGVKPNISHLRIFGCPVYISETSKAYRIFIPGQRHIEVSRDVTLEEEIKFKKSKGSCMEIDIEAHEEPQAMDTDHDPEIQRESTELEAHDDPVEPMDPTDGPRDIIVGRKRPLWARNTMQEAEKNSTP